MTNAKQKGTANYSVQVFALVRWITNIGCEGLTLTQARSKASYFKACGMWARIATDSGLIVE